VTTKTFRINSDIQTGAKIRHGDLGWVPDGKIPSRPDLPREVVNKSRHDHHHPETAEWEAAQAEQPPDNKSPKIIAMSDTISNPRWTWIRERGMLDDLQLEEVKEEYNRSGKPISEILQNFGLLDLDAQLQVVADYLGTEVVDVTARELTPDILARCRRRRPHV